MYCVVKIRLRRNSEILQNDGIMPYAKFYYIVEVRLPSDNKIDLQLQELFF